MPRGEWKAANQAVRWTGVRLALVQFKGLLTMRFERGTKRTSCHFIAQAPEAKAGQIQRFNDGRRPEACACPATH